MPTTPCGPPVGGGGGVVGWLNTNDVGPDGTTRRHHKRWDCVSAPIPTAMVSADPYVEGEQKGRQPRPAVRVWEPRPRLNATADADKDTRLNAAFYGTRDRHRRHASGARCWASRVGSSV